MSKCPRPMTGREKREYDEKVKALGGPSSKAGKAFIEAEHRKFTEGLAKHNREHGIWHAIWHG